MIKTTNLSMCNKGEKGEIEVVKKIFTLSKNNDIDTLTSIFGDDAEKGIILCDVETNIQISDIHTIKKSKHNCKTDFVIKFIKTDTFMNCSIKCKHGAMPTILNHTPRSANVFQTGGYLFSELENLDKFIKSINKKRESKLTGEDIDIEKTKINNKLKKTIINVVSYFLFSGTGSCHSKYPVNSILDVYDPKDITKWKFYNCDTDEKKKEYTQNIYNKLVISLRDKGMPKSTDKIELCKPWIFQQKKEDGTIKCKGSLHIRIKK